MGCAGLTIENKSTGCREPEYQVLGTEVPGIGNRSTRHRDNRIESPAKEHRCSSQLNSLLITPGKTTEQEVQLFLQAEEQP